MQRDDAYLLDMLLAARDAVLQRAMMHCLQVVGEAARHVSRERQERHPEIAWRRWVRLRNRLIHEYF